ncbi:MAG TPA: serine/threonine protein kinase [Macromonas sp.]|nr:serine/threonine protein kinase [Macromonas sp.]
MHTPTPDDRHPYEALTPDVVLDALASVGLWGDGRLTALSSYENRVYQAYLESGEAVVLKFYRPARWTVAQIEEEHTFAWALQDAEVPVVAPQRVQGCTLHPHAGFHFSVSPWRGGRRPELDDPDVLEWIGRFLARIHSVGAAQPFAARPALDVATFGEEPVAWLLAHDALPLESCQRWQDAAHAALTLARERLAVCAGSVDDGAVSTLRLHGDCHPGNILWTPTDRPGGGPHFVDLDDARTGPAVQDLWMLLSGDRFQQQAQLGALLDGYEQFRDFDRRELALIEPLRTLRLIHYSAWLARRWSDPIFPINFPWFGTAMYWQEQAQQLWDQVAAMEAPPLVA